MYNIPISTCDDIMAAREYGWVFTGTYTYCCFTNIGGPLDRLCDAPTAEEISLYQQAIDNTGFPLWIGECDSRGVPGWKGLWGERHQNLAPFWRELERLREEAKA